MRLSHRARDFLWNQDWFRNIPGHGISFPEGQGDSFLFSDMPGFRKSRMPFARSVLFTKVLFASWGRCDILLPGLQGVQGAESFSLRRSLLFFVSLSLSLSLSYLRWFLLLDASFHTGMKLMESELTQ